MIHTQDAIAAARAKIGTPYGSGAGEIDCINLIKHIIRTCPGGVKGYTTAGTNTLWASYAMSAKYRDLTWRQEGIAGARAGMLAFKRSGADTHHVGLVTGAGTVIHASSARGAVVETPLTAAEGWNLLGTHRYIEAGEEEAFDGRERASEASSGEGIENSPTRTQRTPEAFDGRAIVCAQGGLRQRDSPGGRYMQMIPDGARITITLTCEGWGRTVWRGHAGWVSLAYLCRADGND